MDATLKRPTDGWALRRNLWVHGLNDPLEYLDAAKQYSLKGREQLITCPTFVCATEGDDLSAHAGDFADRLTVDHEFVRFTAAEGVFGHCEMAGRAAYLDRMFTWLDNTLKNSR